MGASSEKELLFWSRIFALYRHPGAGRDLEGHESDQNVTATANS
jgi:hypothetical protein